MFLIGTWVLQIAYVHMLEVRFIRMIRYHIRLFFAKATIRLRFRYQDYAVIGCEMSLINPVTGVTGFIINFTGVRCGDFITCKVETSRPPIGAVFHLIPLEDPMKRKSCTHFRVDLDDAWFNDHEGFGRFNNHLDI